MNLFDIVKRRDRALRVEAGTVEPVHRTGERGFFGVSMTEDSAFRLLDSHTYAAFRRFPRSPGWTDHLKVAPEGSQGLRISLEAHDGRRHVLYQAKKERASGFPIELDWPAWAGFTDGYDLVFANTGAGPCDVASTWLFNPRLNLRPLIRGDGVEVGPGTNPFVKPDDETRVRYVEAAPIDQWVLNYGKTLKADDLKELWSSYIIGDAVTLDIVEDDTLDYIFSSHVFEHLVNPLGVLQNWSRKLRRGGIVAAVIPDLRYCFDLRQIPSVDAEWEAEFAAEVRDLAPEKFEKWCRYTAPTSTPESLIARNYSIHAHYYTSETIVQLIENVIGRGWFDRYFLNAAPNNKDFGIILRRSDG